MPRQVLVFVVSLILLGGCCAPPTGAQQPDPPQQAGRLGWYDEPMPEGMRKGAEKPVYIWDTGKGLEIDMVYVPPGPFIMGSHDPAAPDWEKPQHTREMPDGYYIGRYETTWGEYKAFCAAAGRDLPESPKWEVTDQHPVVNVSWEDARAFCEWAGLSLPTEAQWEKAARGTDGRTYPWGDEWDLSKCNALDDEARNGLWKTAPVGSFPGGASAHGAMNVAGNVSEWCKGWFFRTSYADFVHDREPAGEGVLRPSRGGSWFSTEVSCRTSSRSGNDPVRRHSSQGFRPATAD